MGEAYNYVSSYHTLPLNDKDLPAMQTVSVQRYYSPASKDDTRARCKAEGEKLWQALVKLKIEDYGSSFYFPSTDVLGKTEEPFYRAGLKRVFAGRGSPMEIRDVLRLAIRAGRIGKGGVRPTLDAYVHDFMTLDCNAFMGNLFNLSPHMHIANWAVGDGTKDDSAYKGWLEADNLTKPYLPLKPILAASDIGPCDVIITVKRNVQASMGRFVHIAVVDGISPAGNGKYYVQVVEWGGHGADNHYAPDTFEIIDGPELPGIGEKKDGTPKKGKKLGVGFWEKDKNIKTDNIFRYFFKKPCEANPATWGRCGLEEV